MSTKQTIFGASTLVSMYEKWLLKQRNWFVSQDYMVTCSNINSTFSKDKKHFTIGIEPRIKQTRWQRGEVQTARKQTRASAVCKGIYKRKDNINSTQ